MRRRIFAFVLGLLIAASAGATGLFDIVTKGSTDRSVTVDIIDSTDGTPETAVVFNTSGIDLWYRREGAALTSITEATLAALTTAHSDGGFLHIANGTYRLDLPDAAFATGANYVDFGGTVTGMIVIGGRVRLVDANLEVANLAANVTQISGDSPAADNLEAAYDDTQGEVPWSGIPRQGTAQAASSTTVTLDASAPFGDDTILGATLAVKGATNGNYWQSCSVSDYVASTKVATISCPAGFVTPTGAIAYKIWGVAPASSSGGGLDAAGVRAAVGLASANLDTQLGAIDDFVDTEVAAIKTKTDFLPSATAGAAGGLFIAGTNAATTVTTAFTTTFTGNLTGSAGSVTGAVGSVTGNVGGTVNGLTSTAQGNVRTALGLGSANLDTQLSGLATAAALSTLDGKVDTVDSVADAIKVKTDQLTFGVTNTLNVNVEYMNATQLCGIGTAGNLFRGC